MLERQQSKRSGNDNSPQIVPINLLEQEPKVDIGESILRYQNTCLATRIDYQKRLIGDQRKIISDLTNREYRYQAFFKNLYVAWTSFLSRNQRIHQMLKRTGECKLEGKFTGAFAHLDQIFQSQNLFAEDETYSRHVSNNFKDFLKLIENIYMEISAEHGQWLERVMRDVQSYDNDQESEYLRTLVRQCKEILATGKELESSFKLKIQLREKKVNDLDVQFGHQSLFKIQHLLSEARSENMHLTRRVRLLTEYNFKSIKHKAEENNDDVKGENFECVCGGAQIAAYRSLIDPQLSFIASSIDSEELKRPPLMGDSLAINNSSSDDLFIADLHVNVNHLNQLIQKAVRNRSMKLERTDDGIYGLTFNSQELRELETILNSYYNMQQKAELFVAQNKRLQEQAIRHQEQIKLLELRLSNCQEQFFQSDLFHFLQQHNRHLTEVNSMLCSQIRDLQIELHDSIHSRQVEISSLRHQYEMEITKLAQETSKLRYDLQERRTLDLQQMTQIDIEQFCEGLKGRNAQLQKVVDSQMQELLSQKQQLSDLREKQEQLEKKKTEQMLRIQDLDQKVTVLQAKVPEDFKIENYQFRHQKHKDFILELNNHILSAAPQYRERYAELCAYLKSRDQRVADLEKKIQQMQEHEIKQLKRQMELMLSESEINQKTYCEVQKNAKLVEQQLQIKEQSEARIIQEKIAEKATNDNERTNHLNKLRAAEELIRKLTASNQELQALLTNIQGQKGKKDDFNYREQEFIMELRRENEQLIQAKTVLEMENGCYRSKVQGSNLINLSVVREAEAANQRIIELEEIIKQNEELLNSPKLLEQLKGYIVLNAQSNNMSEIKEVASCSDCTLNLKEVFIWKCAHMLCKDCGERAAFNEQCPICKIRIDISDIWKAKMVAQ